MRLNSTTAATLTAAGLAALITGCSSGSSSAGGPVVVHHQAAAQTAAQPAAAPTLTAKQQLAKAVRASLAGHTVQFRYRNSVALVDPAQGEDVNPYAVGAGIANFDSNFATMNVVSGTHAAQPYTPAVTNLLLGASEFTASNANAVAGKNWTQSTPGAGDSADLLVTQVMQDIKGPVRIVAKTKYATVFQVRSDLQQLILDQGGSSSDAASFAGTTQTEKVWVNKDGRITRVRWTIPGGHVNGLSASDVRATYVTLDLANYGVDMFVPSHPTA